MTVKTKIAIISIVVIAVVTVAGLVFFRGSWQCQDGEWVAIGHPLTRRPQTACAVTQPVVVPTPPVTVCSPPWSCGKLTRYEPGMKPGTWYLKYDDVTGAEQLEIVFVDDAQCHVDDSVADCAALNPPNGSASSFSGYKDGDVFRVSSVDFTTR